MEEADRLAVCQEAAEGLHAGLPEGSYCLVYFRTPEGGAISARGIDAEVGSFLSLGIEVVQNVFAAKGMTFEPGATVLPDTVNGSDPGGEQ